MLKHRSFSSQVIVYCLSNCDVQQLDDSVQDEIMANQRMIPPGKSLMAINGALINVEDVDLYL